MKPSVIGVVAGLALAYMVGYNTFYAKQQSRVRVIRQKQAQEQTDQQARKNAADLLNQVEQYRAQLPSEPDPSWLVREVMAASQKGGVEITSILQRNPETAKQATAVSVTLQVNATYHQLGRFLDELEHGKRFVHVDQITVNPARSQDDRPSIQVTLSTLYMPPLLSQRQAASSASQPAKSGPKARF